MSQPSNIFPLSYTGVRAQRPPNITVKNFDPQPAFSQNFDIGDFWINFNPQAPTSAKLWVLLGLAGGVANWVEIVASAGDVLTLTGNSGGAVNPVAGNIDIFTANSTVKFIGNNSPANITQDFGLSSLLLGSPGTSLAGALRNVGVGFGALADLSTGADNTAVGYGALTTAAGSHNNNTAIGSLSMTALTTGADNTAVGSDTLSTNTIGSSNTAIGVNALTLFTGSNAVAVGSNALAANSSGSFNTAVGTNACAAVTTGDSNTALGFEALQDVVTGSNNTSIGALSLNSTTGSDNTALGFSALGTVTTGSGNIAIGYEAGLNYIGAESANILIGNSGTAAEDFTIRIGTQGTQTSAYIAGVTGVAVSNPQAVVINSVTGQLGVGAPGGSPIETITGDSGGAVTPTAGDIIFTGGTTGLTFAGTNAPGKETLTGILVAANGGTGSNGSTFTADGVFYWDGTKLVTTSAGAAGQVLTSNGAGVAPTYQAAGAIGAASFFGASQATHITGGIRYYSPYAFGGSASEAVAQMIIPLNGTVDKLYCVVTSNANTVNGTVTVFKNGGATGLTLTITALTTGTFSDLVNSVAFSAGDTISFELSQATTGACVEQISCKFTPT